MGEPVAEFRRAFRHAAARAKLPDGLRARGHGALREPGQLDAEPAKDGAVDVPAFEASLEE